MPRPGHFCWPLIGVPVFVDAQQIFAIAGLVFFIISFKTFYFDNFWNIGNKTGRLFISKKFQPIQKLPLASIVD
jgi:hypothetical protein